MQEDPRGTLHKFHQHDADLDAAHDDDPVERDLDDVLAEAMTPEEYVLSSSEAMAAAIEQAQVIPDAADLDV